MPPAPLPSPIADAAPPAPGRIAALDRLRGLAVMGILLMNVAGFALPAGAYFVPGAVAVHGPFDDAIWAAEFVLVDGKLRNIFSLLFGAGILLVLDRARAAGEDEGTVHLRRMAVLGVVGLAHGWLLWWGDILFQYAAVGAALLFVADRRPRLLLALGVAALALNALLSAGTVAAIADARADPASWRDIAPAIGGGTPADIAAEVAAMHRGYGALLHARFFDEAGPLAMLAAAGLETAGMMLIGMAAFRSGFLTGGRSRRSYRRIAATGYALALPPMVAIAAWTAARGFDPVAAFAAATLWSLPFRPLLALADVALALLWAAGGTGAVRMRIVAVGRTAFTNYLATTAVMTTLFYGYGLGLFGRLDRLALLGIVAATWIAMLAWSKPWLDRYRQGPLEWAWRSLARGRMQPMRR